VQKTDGKIRPIPTSDLFYPYLHRTPKISENCGETETNGVILTRFRFESEEGSFHSDHSSLNEVYAVMARPAHETERKRPGVLICHGGHQRADEAKAIAWAKQGFVALSPELPGWANPDEIKGRSRFQKKPYNLNRFTVIPTVLSCSVFDSITAGLGAFNLLESMEGVDASCLGITGISWGGYLATLLCGYLDHRVRAAFSLYGGGCYEAGTVFIERLNHLPANERRLWLEYYDAGNYADRITASILFYAASNDSFFHPPSVEATLDRIRQSNNYVCFAPNCDHQFTLPGGTEGKEADDAFTGTGTEPVFFLHAMDSQSTPLPQVRVIEADQEAACNHVVFYSSLPSEARCWAFYSDNLSDPWKSRVWKPMEIVEQGEQTCRFTTPDTVGPYDWFAGMTFPLTHGDCSAPMNLSTRIKRVTGRTDNLLCN
jgi:cephalosporin-C deacetylase-like acetyl esterase